MTVIDESRRSHGLPVDTALRWSPLQAMFSVSTGKGTPILAYHGIDDPAAFEAQLEYLRHRYQPVRLADVIAALGGTPMPRRAVLVTFDDGDPSVFRIGLPLLRKYGVPAVAFVVTELVGTTQMLWTHEARSLIEIGAHLLERDALNAAETVALLKRMDDKSRIEALDELRRSAAASPPPASQMQWTDLKTIDQEGLMSIEDHSFSHPQLDRCSPEHVRDEIGRSIEVFEQEMGRRPRAFAYPDGARSDEAARVLESRGYEAAFLFDHRRAHISGGDRWGVSRLRVNSTTSLDRFATILSGLHPAIHRLRGRR